MFPEDEYLGSPYAFIYDLPFTAGPYSLEECETLAANLCNRWGLAPPQRSSQLPEGWPAPPLHIDKLPEDSFHQVLRNLHLQELLQCSLVCQKWQMAVADVIAGGCAAVVDSLDGDTTFDRWVQMACWLRKHSSSIKLHSLDVRVLGRLNWERQTANSTAQDDADTDADDAQHGTAQGDSTADAELACAAGQLQGIRVGSIKHKILQLAAANPLAYVARGLTSLHLTYCSVNLQHLSACSNLRSLKLHYTDLLGSPKYHSDLQILGGTAAAASSFVSSSSSSAGGSSSSNSSAGGSNSSSSDTMPGWLALPAVVSATDDLLERHPSATATLNEALPSLQQLTCLEVTGCISDAYRDDSTDGIIINSSLTQLRELTLSTKVDQTTLAQLPTSLTKLSIDSRGFSIVGPVDVSPSAAPGLCKLSALQELNLTGARFELGTLANFKQLRKLVLRDTELTAGQSSQAVWLKSLRQLQHLQVQFAKPADADDDDAELEAIPAAVGIVVLGRTTADTDLIHSMSAAVAAATQLTYLSLGQFPGSSSQVFLDLAQAQPANLVQTVSESGPGSFVSRAFPPGHTLPNLVTLYAQPGLVTSAADINSIGNSCPSLRVLRLTGLNIEGLNCHFSPLHLPAQRKALQAAAPALDLLGVSQLTALTELRVEGFNMKGAAKGLLQLKRLETLDVQLAVGECRWGYEKLTALTDLTDITVRQYEPDIDVAVFGSTVRPYVLQDELCIAVGSVHTLASFQASMCVSGKLPRALGLYDNIARVARLLRRGQEPWEPVYMDGASSPFPE